MTGEYNNDITCIVLLLEAMILIVVYTSINMSVSHAPVGSVHWR